MTKQFNLRTAIAQPIQKVAKELRPIALNDSGYVNAYNSLCDVLDGFDSKLSRTGNGLNKDWERIT